MYAKLKFPQSIGLGCMLKFSDQVRLGFDFEWINWKNAFDKMSITMKGGTNANISTMLGGRNMSVEFPMNWEDAACLRAGLEFDATNALTLRVGGAFGSNPVSNSSVFPVFPAIVENHFTAGASYALSPSFAVHAAYERALNSSQTSLTPNVVAQEFSGSTSQLNENIFHLSLTWMP